MQRNQWAIDREQDIRNQPEKHKHETYHALANCCIDPNGCLDLYLHELHAKVAPLGYNGGRACDVRKGICSCGTWH